MHDDDPGVAGARGESISALAVGPDVMRRGQALRRRSPVLEPDTGVTIAQEHLRRRRAGAVGAAHDAAERNRLASRPPQLEVVGDVLFIVEEVPQFGRLVSVGLDPDRAA